MRRINKDWKEALERNYVEERLRSTIDFEHADGVSESYWAQLLSSLSKSVPPTNIDDMR